MATCRTASSILIALTHQRNWSRRRIFSTRHFAGLPLDQVGCGSPMSWKRLREDIVVLMTTASKPAPGGTTVQRQPDRIGRAAPAALSQDLAGNVGSLRQLFDLFEQARQLLHLFDQGQQGGRRADFRGGESQVVPLDEFSLVTAPYQVNGPVIRHPRCDRTNAHGPTIG